MTKRLVLILIICLFHGFQAIADEKIDTEVNWRIRREETQNSQIMNLVRHLTDVYGPRLTGSPNFRAACDWSLQQMKQWGMQNENLEKWDFAHPGWSCDKYIVRVLSPYKDTLDSKVVAWTPSTKGAVRAKAIQITPPERPTQESLATYLSGVKDQVRDRIVFVGPYK
jgi:carboxypeptidase Q